MNALRCAIFSLACWTGLQPGACASGLVAFSGVEGNLVKFDPETLLLARGNFGQNATTSNSMAFDENGRLFGTHRDTLFEIDPETLDVLNQRQLTGTLQGLAVHAGKIFSFTGSGAELVALDADTLEVVQGELKPNATFGSILTGDGRGRLFGIHIDQLSEFDPETFAVINHREIEGTLTGLAAHGGKLVAFTGVNGDLMAFDANTLRIVAGEFLTNATTGLSVTFDNNGRLFAAFKGFLEEVDPESLAIIGLREQPGTVLGLAAYTPPPPPPPGESLAPIKSVTRAADGSLRITVAPTFRRSIGIEFSPDLSPGSWIELGNFFEVAGDDSAFVDTDEQRISRSRAYYRAFLRPFVP